LISINLSSRFNSILPSQPRISTPETFGVQTPTTPKPNYFRPDAHSKSPDPQHTPHVPRYTQITRYGTPHITHACTHIKARPSCFHFVNPVRVCIIRHLVSTHARMDNTNTTPSQPTRDHRPYTPMVHPLSPARARKRKVSIPGQATVSVRLFLKLTGAWWETLRDSMKSSTLAFIAYSSLDTVDAEIGQTLQSRRRNEIPRSASLVQIHPLLHHRQTRRHATSTAAPTPLPLPLPCHASHVSLLKFINSPATCPNPTIVGPMRAALLSAMVKRQGGGGSTRTSNVNLILDDKTTGNW
jgi:hypothetical protein